MENPKQVLGNIGSTHFSVNQIPNLGWFLLLLGLTDTSSSLINLVWTPSWPTRTSFISAIFTILLVSVGLYMSARKEKVKATYWIIAGIGFRCIVISLIIKDTGITMQLFLLVISAITVLEWIPSKKIIRIMPAVFVVSLFALLTDMIQPAWRIKSLINPSLAILVILLFFIFYAVVNFPKFGIQIKLIFIFLSLTIISITGIAYATYTLAQRAILENARFALQSSAQSLSSSIDSFINYNLKSIQSDAASPELAAYLDLDEEERILPNAVAIVASLLENYSHRAPSFIESYALLDINGVDVVDTDIGDIGINLSAQVYYIETLAKGLPYVSPVYISPTTDNLSIYFSAPVRDYDNQIVGVLRVRYKAEILQSLVLKANEQGGEGSFGVLLDEYNIVLAHGKESTLISQALIPLDLPIERDLKKSYRLPEDAKYLNLFDIYKNLNSNDGSTFFMTSLVSKQPVPAAAHLAVLTENPWKILIFEPENSFYEPLDRQANLIILIAEGSAILIILIGSNISRIFIDPITSLTRTAEAISNGDLHAKSPITSQDEIGKLASTMNTMSAQLFATQTTLNGRIQERTRMIESAVQVGRILSTILEVDELSHQVVNELQTTFGYYHVDIYILCKDQKELLLTAGTGEISEKRLTQGFKRPLGGDMVGRAALTGTKILVQNSHLDQTWLPDPLLPDTQAEIAIPILLGVEVLGVIDVQQNIPNSLNQQDVDLLQLVSSQVAISLRNADLFNSAKDDLKLQTEISLIVESIRATTSIEEALRVVAEEISRYTGGRYTKAHLQLENYYENASLLPVKDSPGRNRGNP